MNIAKSFSYSLKFSLYFNNVKCVSSMRSSNQLVPIVHSRNKPKEAIQVRKIDKIILKLQHN